MECRENPPPNWSRVEGWKKTCLHKAFKNMRFPEQHVEKMEVFFHLLVKADPWAVARDTLQRWLVSVQ